MRQHDSRNCRITQYSAILSKNTQKTTFSPPTITTYALTPPPHLPFPTQHTLFSPQLQNHKATTSHALHSVALPESSVWSVMLVRALSVCENVCMWFYWVYKCLTYHTRFHPWGNDEDIFLAAELEAVLAGCIVFCAHFVRNNTETQILTDARQRVSQYIYTTLYTTNNLPMHRVV